MVCLKSEFHWYAIIDMFHWHCWYYLALQKVLNMAISHLVTISVSLTDFLPSLMLLLRSLERVSCLLSCLMFFHKIWCELCPYTPTQKEVVWPHLCYCVWCCSIRQHELCQAVFKDRSLLIFVIAIFTTCIASSAAPLLAGWAHVFDPIVDRR